MTGRCGYVNELTSDAGSTNASGGLQNSIAECNVPASVPADRQRGIQFRKSIHAQHNTTQHNTLMSSLGLVDCSSIQGLACDSVEPVGPERTTKPKRFRLDWFSVFGGKTPRQRRNRRSYVPAEVLEQRQLLAGDPMSELNTKFTLAIGMSNADIDAFFNGGSSSATGGLNGALGGAAAKFNQLPLNGSEIEDSAITEVSSQFGTVETRVGSSIDAIKAAKPIIAFPDSLNIGVPYDFPMMMMPGMQIGSRGYTFVNAFTGDFYGTSNWIVEIPASTGVMASRLSMQGTISQTDGVQSFNIVSDFTKQLPGGNVGYYIEFANPGSGEILKFGASQTFGQITTFANAEIVGGVTNYSSFGGSGNFGDMTASFSKTHMYQTDRLFGAIEYQAGNTKASAEFMQHTGPNANVTVSKAMMSSINLLADREKYLQVGAGSVTGTVSGQAINETFGTARMNMPIKRIFGHGPQWLDASSTWHNGIYSGSPPVLSSEPLDIGLKTLFISHDNYKSDIWGQVNQFRSGLKFTY